MKTPHFNVQFLIKLLALMHISALLSGCLGASIGQQVVQSIILQGADKATANAIETYERNEATKAKKTAEIDPYTIAMLNMEFKNVTPDIEPVPENVINEHHAEATIQTHALIQVELWNLIVKTEKHALLEQASAQGIPDIPPKNEWDQWEIATGGQATSHQMVTFLIPPEMGKLQSGKKVMVEILPTSVLSMARYRLD